MQKGRPRAGPLLESSRRGLLNPGGHRHPTRRQRRHDPGGASPFQYVHARNRSTCGSRRVCRVGDRRVGDRRSEAVPDSAVASTRPAARRRSRSGRRPRSRLSGALSRPVIASSHDGGAAARPRHGRRRGSGRPDHQERFASGGAQRSYHLFVPVGGARPAPLIVLLHGSGRDGRSLAEPWRQLAAEEAIMLAARDSFKRESWGMREDGPHFLHELIETISEKHPVDRRRMYLFGHSGGDIIRAPGRFSRATSSGASPSIRCTPSHPGDGAREARSDAG
jgi:hypothetical protein